MRKINELLRETIADEVSKLKDPGIGFVTITGVETAPDLRTAVVYYSALGTPEEQADSAAGLERAVRRIQSGVARRVRLRYTPRLEFRVDPSIEHGMRIDELLRDLSPDEDVDE